eukprot:TRINITY_DN11663_c0_g1_i1.p1 TRINITY_DN11663_c0_g1~~TRINITY_DN11663_c0_g1_i1.p1  ORF type:complete len:306 (-),score=75.43 TRINITY_DN11663_c0_g1_i1:54-971(-)
MLTRVVRRNTNRKHTIKNTHQSLRFGSLKELKLRQASVKSIGKITNTMKVVASSKLQGVQNAAAMTSDFFRSQEKLFSPLAPNNQEEKPKDIKTLTLVITTDKGLCGALNSAIFRMLRDEPHDDNNSFVIVGEKGCKSFSQHNTLKSQVSFSGHQSPRTPFTFLEAGETADRINKLDNFDQLRVIFNRFVTPTKLDIDVLYLPSYGYCTSSENYSKFDHYYVAKLERKQVIRNAIEYLYAATVNYASYQNQAVEIFSRRNAMDNASTNADEVYKKLSILYNKTRQAAITTELSEISAGAAAVEEG